MPDEALPDADSSPEKSPLPVIVEAEAVVPPALSMALRVKFVLTGILFPMACFIAPAVGMTATSDQPWQSGRLADYLAMLLQWPSFAPLLPIVGFSMICLAAWVAYPELACKRWIRAGLCGGVVLSAQFLACVLATSSLMTIVAAVFVGPLLALAVWSFCSGGRLAKRFTIRHLLIVTTMVAVAIPIVIKSGLINPATDLPVLFGGLLFWIVAATPTLNFITYTRASIRSFQLAAQDADEGNWQDPIGITILVSWSLAWLGSWRLAVASMSLEYSKLPTTDPNCYVSSAAAHGHHQLVGEDQLACGHVNLQMQRLKLLEWALAAGFPRCHRLVRQTYDFAGPPLASVCKSSVWFADATYMMLKPIEYVAILIRIATGISAGDVTRIYRRTNES